MAYIQKCKELALHLLPLGGDDTVDDLAQHIQAAIDGWVEANRSDLLELVVRPLGPTSPADVLAVADAMNRATGLTSCHTGNAEYLIAAIQAAGLDVVKASLPSPVILYSRRQTTT